MPTSSESAVSAFSPPESSSTFCSFLPGGEAMMSMPLWSLFSASGSVSRMNAWPPPKSFVKVCREVLVDDLERLVELHARDLVDLLDRRLRVLDRLDQVLALRLQEPMPLGRLVVLLERHHVHRAHCLEPLLQRRAPPHPPPPAPRLRDAQSSHPRAVSRPRQTGPQRTSPQGARGRSSASPRAP